MTDPAAVPPPGVARRFLPAAAPALLGWILLAALQLLLGRLVSGAGTTDERIPAWARLTLAASELVLLALAIAVLAAVSALGVRLGRKSASRAGWFFERILRAGPAAAFLFFWSASWTIFGATGRFVDQRTVEFFGTNGSLLVQFLTAGQITWGACLAAICLAVPAAWILLGPRLLARVPERRAASFSRMACGLMAFCLIGAAFGEIRARSSEEGVLDQFTKIRYPMAKFYESRRDHHTGPVISAVSALTASGSGLPPGTASSAVEVVRRPQQTMAQVLAGVDKAALRRPNVVVIVVDSVRADHLQAYGATRSVMPNLDALAAEGRSFLDTRTQASHTNYANPVPLSSNYPLRSRDIHIYPDKVRYPRVFIWDVLKAVGYRTVLLSSQDQKWGNMIGYMANEGLDEAIDPEGQDLDDRETVDRAIRWVEGAGEAPFMMFLNLQNPHWPYKVPADWPRRFGKTPKFRWPFVGFDPARKSEIKDLYADALAYSDEQIGRFLDALKRRGAWDRTIVVATSDHGQAFLEHGFASHASKLYDEVAKVPLIFRGPGVERGADRRPAQLLDVPPSILALMGLPSHPSFQGLNLFDARFPEVRSRYMVAHSALAMQYAVERGGLKLIHDEEFGLDMLFDLRQDPLETTDLSREQPSTARDLAWRLSVWRQAQLEYFESEPRRRTEYPPVLIEK